MLDLVKVEQGSLENLGLRGREFRSLILIMELSLVVGQSMGFA